MNAVLPTTPPGGVSTWTVQTQGYPGMFKTTDLKHDVSAITRPFQIGGEFRSAERYASGHINDTYCTLFRQGIVPVRYILQRINHNILKTPVGWMENPQRVTAHLVAARSSNSLNPSSNRRRG